MNISYEKFNEWEESLYKACMLIPLKQVRTCHYYAFAKGEDVRFSEDDEQAIKAAADGIDVDSIDLRDEIDFNIVNFQTDASLKRYLTLMLEKAKSQYEVCERNFEYAILRPVEFRFSPQAFRENPEPNILMLLFLTYQLVLVAIEEVIDHIEGKLENLSSELPVLLDNELNYTTHRLLLLHRLGVFDKLKESYYEHLGAVRFTKLISTLLGVPPEKSEGLRPSITSLIKEDLKPNSPKKIQTDDALNKVTAYLTELGLIPEMKV